MQWIVKFLILFILIWIERLIPSHLSNTGFIPDLVLIALIAWLPRQTRAHGMVAGFVGGLLQDLSSPGLLGITALAKVLACAAAGSLPKGRFRHQTIWIILAIVVAGAVQQLVFTIVLRGYGASGALIPLLRYGLPQYFVTIFYAGLVGIFIDYRSGSGVGN